LVFHTADPNKIGQLSLTLQLPETPAGAVLQAIEDTFRDYDLRLCVREYGILVSLASAPPEGAPTVQEFWKGAAKAKPEAPQK
jgi:hypothetical protein